APAGERPAGTPGASPYNVILPSGRIVAPVGVSVPVGMNALGVALSPDGKYAVVTNDDEREFGARNAIDPRVLGGYSITVIDTRTMRVADIYQSKGADAFFIGIAAVSDPAKSGRTIVLASEGPLNQIKVFDLSIAGKLTPEDLQIPVPAPIDEKFANQNHAFPASIVVSPDGKRAYVANNLANTVSAIDVANRRLLGTAPVGFFPYGVAISGLRLLVTDEGLMNYGVLPSPATHPQFANVVADQQRASALSVVALNSSRDIAPNHTAGFVPMDPAPDGEQTVGGAHPSAIVTSHDGRYAYVAMTNVDRIATLSLSGPPTVIGGLQLRLFDKAPYGTQPDALVLSHDGKTLYAALAGINAIAILDARDPAHLHRIGLIPTGWYPSALALSPSGRYLYVANAKGYGQDRHFNGRVLSGTQQNSNVDLDSNAIWSTLQRVDLHRLPIAKTTSSALRYLRAPHASTPMPAVVPALRSGLASSRIQHVVFILEENKTYDSMLGDLKDSAGNPHGNGEPLFTAFGETVTPNLHALARTFGLATNEYADAEESDAGHQFAAAGIASDYTEKTLLVKGGRTPLVNKNEDPEDYPRAGYIFNSLLHSGMSYRDYGDLIRLSGYDEGRDENPKADDPDFRSVDDTSAPTKGLGGLYSLDVPAPLALRDHVDPNYPGWNLRIRDVRRAHEFINDYGAYVRAGTVPQFTYIWLPADHGGRGPNIPAIPEEVADGDRALGMIVDYLSHLKTWDSTAIFVMPDDAQSTRDHVSEHRSYAIVVSPYAKRSYIGTQHISTVSVLKTEEELLGLPPLSLGDLLATDLADYFTDVPNTAPFTALPVATQTASREGSRIADLLKYTDQSGPDADVKRSAALIDLSRRADRLAQERGAMGESSYNHAQAALYQAALHVLGRVKS
ncbi:MAG: beta-propeller fold lactonase family protein, partial [Candidatus Eremiobacteraeota bacterium]|nr:beta-propeller fold lactonase family protein [Candidatus Eremiobacteraeota bacterium]